MLGQARHSPEDLKGPDAHTHTSNSSPGLLTDTDLCMDEAVFVL